MQHNNNIQVAGPTTQRGLAPQITEAKTFMMLRSRLRTVAKQATTPPHRRRPKKGSKPEAGRWPSRITFDSLEL